MIFDNSVEIDLAPRNQWSRSLTFNFISDQIVGTTRVVADAWCSDQTSDLECNFDRYEDDNHPLKSDVMPIVDMS